MNISDEDFSDLNSEIESILLSNAEDPEFYGQKYNVYNPEVHILCFLQDIHTMSDLIDALRLLTDNVEELMDRGWQLATPIIDGLIQTVWEGEGSPPKEDSQFGEDGYDLDGNHIDDWNEE